MKPESINTNVRAYLMSSQFTTSEDIDRILRLGLLATHSTQFLEHVAFVVGADGVFILNEFYRNFLGMYDLICVDKSMVCPTIRLCNQVSANAQEGVQLTFQQVRYSDKFRITLHRLTASFDTTASTIVKEYT